MTEWSLRLWGAPDLSTNRWGIPDWKSADAYYPATEEWDGHRWRWEFLRRLDQYRFDFEEAAERRRFVWGPKNDVAMIFGAYGERALEGYRHLFADEEIAALMDDRSGLTQHPDLPGVSVGSPAAARYGLPALWNPAISDHGGLGPEFFGVDEFFDLNVLGVADGREVSTDLSDGLSRVQRLAFDLDKPIGPQLDAAKMELASIQADYLLLVNKNAGVVRSRDRRDIWPHYLRVIDAKASGATWGEIQEILPDHIGASAKRQSASQFWRQAAAVMDKMAGLSTTPS